MAIDLGQLQAWGGYESNAPLGTVLEDLDQAGNVLEELASARRRIGGFAALSIAAGLVAAIVSGSLSSRLGVFTSLFAIVFGVVLIVYLIIQRHGLHQHRDRVPIAKELCKTLIHDGNPRAPFSIRLGVKENPRLLSDEPWTARKSGNQKLWEEDFLSIQCELLDATALSETVTELSRKRTYKNQNGKTKTKLRYRYMVALRLVYPSDLYGDARSAFQALPEDIRVPSSATLRSARVTEKAISVKALVNVKKDVAQTSAMLCLGAYRILNLARRTAASGSTGAA